MNAAHGVQNKQGGGHKKKKRKPMACVVFPVVSIVGHKKIKVGMEG